MKMKFKVELFMLLLFAFMAIVACEDDNDKNQWTTTSDPVLNLSVDKIHSKQGRIFTIKGIVTDEVGVDKINVNIDEWYLNRDIQVLKNDSLVKSYNLSYNFEIPEDAANKEFIVKITVTNVGGRVTSQNISVFMDGDFDLPTLAVSSPADGLTVSPDAEIPLDVKCAISDARQLGYIVVKEASLNLYDSISFKGALTQSYSYSKTVTLPAKVADYSFNITVADSAGLIVTSTRTVKASYIYAKMYLADVATDADLVSDLFGVPMLIKTTGDNLFKAQYYAEKANVEVKFIPQTSSFAPHCFGIDPNNRNSLIDSQSALPIVLPSIGYYEITLDMNKLIYAVKQYTPTDVPFTSNTNTTDDNAYIGEMGLVGKGFPEYTNQNWSPKTAIVMDRDANNLYRFSKTIDMEGTVEFIISPQHQNGWWVNPFWRFDRKVDPEATILKGGDNVAMTVATRTTYKLVFDSHLNRAKAVKVK